mgnify:CR=1 FL=1
MFYLEAQKFVYWHRCAECGNVPSIYPNDLLSKGKSGYFARCQNPEHKGFIKEKSPTQIYREGGNLPVYLANVIERKYGGERMESKQLMILNRDLMTERLGLAAKTFGFVVDQTGVARAPTGNEIALLVDYCLTYGFDPLMREVILFQGSPYVQIDGLRRKAQETGKYRGLKMEPIMDPNVKIAVGFGADDIVFKGTISKVENGEVSTFERYGGVARWEIDKMSEKDPKKHRYPIVADRPSDMAQNRLERDLIRIAFQFTFPGVQQITPTIEGEYREVAGAPSTPSTTQLEKETQQQAAKPYPITETQKRRIHSAGSQMGYTEEDRHNLSMAKFGKGIKELTSQEAELLIKAEEAGETVKATG